MNSRGLELLSNTPNAMRKTSSVDAIAISNLKLSMTHSLNDWEGYVLGDAIASKNIQHLIFWFSHFWGSTVFPSFFTKKEFQRQVGQLDWLQEIDEMITTVDKNQDGKISYSEFRVCFYDYNHPCNPYHPNAGDAWSHSSFDPGPPTKWPKNSEA